MRTPDQARWWLPAHISNLKLMPRSAAHYEYACRHDSEETAWGRIGQGFHSLVLGGKLVVCFEGRRDPRSKEWQTFQEDRPDALILNRSEYAIARGMADAVKAHPQAMELLERCRHRETDIASTLLGLPCEGRLDAHGTGLVIELKSDQLAQPDPWQRRAQRLGYAAQLDWYRTLLGAPSAECYSIVVEKTPPYLVVVHRATERLLEEGRRCWRLWLEQLRVCIDSQHWPGYAESIVDWDSAELEQGTAEEWTEETAAQ